MTNAAARAEIEGHAKYFLQSFAYRYGGVCRLEGCLGEFFAQGNPRGFIASCENTIVPNFAQSGRQNMQHEPTDKLRRRHGHIFLSGVTVVSPRKRNLIVLYFKNTVVRDSNPVRVTAKVVNNLGSILKWWFAIDDPFVPVQRRIER